MESAPPGGRAPDPSAMGRPQGPRLRAPYHPFPPAPAPPAAQRCSSDTCPGRERRQRGRRGRQPPPSLGAQSCASNPPLSPPIPQPAFAMRAVTLLLLVTLFAAVAVVPASAFWEWNPPFWREVGPDSWCGWFPRPPCPMCEGEIVWGLGEMGELSGPRYKERRRDRLPPAFSSPRSAPSRRRSRMQLAGAALWVSLPRLGLRQMIQSGAVS